MAKVLVLGAGMVSRPAVRYLLGPADYEVTVASRTVAKAQALVEGFAAGSALALDAEDTATMDRLVADADVVVSLLPYAYHPKVAQLCLAHGKHMVTTSYVSDAMRAFDGRAREAGLLFLNECGVDPGIDHMSAMRVMDGVRARGGTVVAFRSMTGALPAPEAALNPFGYKFSWSPRGVLLASRNAARFLEDGKVVEIPGERLFESSRIRDIDGVGSFEDYPNRDSLPYRDLYGLESAHTVYRGTLRMIGWCGTLRAIVALGWLSEDPPAGFSGSTYGDLTRHLLGAPAGDDLAGTAAGALGLQPYAAVIHRLRWLGLFGDEPLPADRDNPLDWLNVLTLRRMALAPGERDMIVMHHRFAAEYPDGSHEQLTSTLVDYGQPAGDTSVARTVSLPAAMAVKMIVEGKIRERGVQIPTQPGVYNPILDELETMGIRFTERSEREA